MGTPNKTNFEAGIMRLRRELLQGKRKLAVWGTGYIGFSTMANFAAQGVFCTGTDVSDKIVDTINRGEIPVPNMEYWLGFNTSYLVKSGMMSATTDWKRLLAAEYAVHLIAIPTEHEDKPWDGALVDVIEKIASIGKRSDPPLVIIESTLTPNKTDKVVIPIFEKKGMRVGKDVLLGVAPRRDWFISPEKNLKSLPRIVGGTTQETTQMMVDVLGIVCDTLVQAPDHKHAEIVKSVENAFRHAEITLANQLSLAYPSLNMTEVLRLVGTKWNVGTYHPSFGSGGYCLAGREQVVASLDGEIQFLPISQLYDHVRRAREGIVLALSYNPGERRSCFRKVTAMSKRVSPTVTFRTVGGHELTVTGNHIMYVAKRKRLWKKPARDLKAHDEIPFLQNLPYFKYSIGYPPYVKKGRARRGHVVDLQYFAKNTESHRKIGSGRQRLATGMGRSSQEVPRFLRIDSDLAFLIGLYAAEGCVTRDASTLRTYLSFHKDERELIQRAKSILDQLGIRYHEYDEKSSKTHQIRVSSRIWGNFVREMTGGGSLRAQLPWFLLFWHNRNLRSALLGGALNGDGSISPKGNFEFYTVSDVLQQQLIYLLRAFRLSPTVNRSRKPPMIRLAGTRSREFLRTVLIGAKLKTLKDYSNAHSGPMAAKYGETSKPRIRDAKMNGTELVYSLEVEGNHNFFSTSGWLVHNCIPLSSHYVLEGAEKPEHLTILRDTIATDSDLPIILADNLIKRGVRNVGILGIAYKGDLKVHVLSPTLRITKRLTEKGVKVKINDPYYNTEEIRRLTGAENFEFPDGLVEFDCVVIVAGHRLYKAISESKLRSYLKNCKLILDNLEETWRDFDWHSSGIRYVIAGDPNWIE
jgi:UDP-N-acetyl-D-mannosaminuronate dehydrogenase